MRVSSVIARLASCGTLKSAHINTVLFWISMSFMVNFAIFNLLAQQAHTGQSFMAGCF
jgi:hypothetical protein